MELLQNFIIVLLTAVVVLVILSRLKIPSVIGFLITGVIIGTVGANFVHASHELEVMAEIGIILLMFTIGLEFSIIRIKQMKHEVLIYGGFQVIFTIGAVWVIMFLTGFSNAESIIAAFIISLSSTAIVLKIMQDKAKLQTPNGRIMLGILLFQDLCIVPMIILTPLLSSIGEVDALQILLKLARSFGLILVIFLLAKYLLPKLFDFVINSRVSELFILMIIGLCFGLALFTYALGFSVALGAFIAGMILAESDYIHQIEADIKPLKTLFLSVFFITVGMLLNIDYLVANPFKIITVITGILILKAGIIAGILILYKNSWSLALKVGLGLSQIGEFAFMLLSIARPLDIISENFYQLFLSASVISMLFTPLVILLGDKLGSRQRLMQKISETLPLKGRNVIIAGFGINGINLSRIFKALNISYRIIDMNPATVKKYKEAGEPIVFGDITQLDNLKIIGIEEAALLVIAISDAEATKKAIGISRKSNPELQIIVRSEFITQIENLYELGANVVISQDFEASLQIASYVLKFFGIAEPIAKIKSDQLRKRHYQFFTEGQATNQLKIAELAAVKYFNETYLALENPGLVEKRIIELNERLMQNFSYVRIIGIIRNDTIITEIGEEVRVDRMDTLIVYGEQQKLDMAVEYLDNYS